MVGPARWLPRRHALPCEPHAARPAAPPSASSPAGPARRQPRRCTLAAAMGGKAVLPLGERRQAGRDEVPFSARQRAIMAENRVTIFTRRPNTAIGKLIKKRKPSGIRYRRKAGDHTPFSRAGAGFSARRFGLSNPRRKTFPGSESEIATGKSRSRILDFRTQSGFGAGWVTGM